MHVEKCREPLETGLEGSGLYCKVSSSVYLLYVNRGRDGIASCLRDIALHLKRGYLRGVLRVLLQDSVSLSYAR